MLHKVSEGEIVSFYAVQYRTTTEAIKKVNYYLPSPLPINWIVVIPLGITDVSAYPPFEPYMVSGEVLSVEALAKKLAVDVTALATYNALAPGYVLTTGDWLLIPRINPKP